MCTSCALALDGVDDGERCIPLDTWHVSTIRIRTCEVAFVIRCGHKCGETHVDLFVSAVALHVWE